jgi:thiamine-monophosphate kinase
MRHLNEFGLIREIQKRFPMMHTKTVGIGDDCAVLDGQRLVTTDALVDGVHFLSAKADFNDIGYKAAAVNISDLAAGGGYPLYAWLTLGIPDTLPDEKIDQFLRGLEEARRDFPFDLVGGDTVKSPVFFVSMTFEGKVFGKPLLRSGAKKGDYVYVTGRIGDSRIGLELVKGSLRHEVLDRAYFLQRHYRPAPRVALMSYLDSSYEIRSAIDLSDGLLADAAHVAEASGVGFFIDLEDIPLSRDRIGSSVLKDERYFLGLALNGGEDYEIFFTSPERIDCDKALEKTGVPVTSIGYVREGASILNWNDAESSPEDWPAGFTHF